MFSFFPRSRLVSIGFTVFLALGFVAPVSLSPAHAQSTTANSTPPKTSAPPKAATAAKDDKGLPKKEQTVKRSGTDRSTGKLIQIAPLNKKTLPATCGCAFYAPTNQRDSGPMWLWLDDKGNAQMNLDGQVQQLSMTSQRMVKRKKDADRLSAGDRVLVTLKSKDPQAGFQASVSSSAERNCTISAKVCSAPTFKSLITLSKGDSKRSLGSWSVCSCPGSSKPYSPPPPSSDSAKKDDANKKDEGKKPATAKTAAPTGGSNPRPAAEKK